MGGSMEPVALNGVFLGPFIRDPIGSGVVGNGLVKGGFEHPDQDFVGKKLLEDAEGLDVGGIVGRSQEGVGLHGLDHLVGHHHRVGDALGVHRLETNGVQLLQAGQDLGRRVGQDLEGLLDGRAMVGAPDVPFLLGTVSQLVAQRRTGAAHPLDLANRNHRFIFHLEQPELQRRGTDVDHQKSS